MRALQALTMAFTLVASPAAALPNWQLSNTDHMIVLQGRSDDSVKEALELVDTLIIERGDGGSVNGMFESLAYLKNHPHKRVIINGACYSACTLLLTLPQQVTFTKKADFYFHSAARSSCVGNTIQRKISAEGNRRMWRAFNGRVQQWILHSKAYHGFEKFTRLSNAEAASMMPEMVMPPHYMIQYIKGKDAYTPNTSSLFPDCGSNK